MAILHSGMVLFRRPGFFCLAALVGIVRHVVDYLKGTAARRARIKNGTDNSGRVAEISRVLARIPNAGMMLAGDVNFIRWHEKFVTVDYLLKPNVTLYFIDTTRAFFVECSPSDNVYDIQRFPFYFIAQRETCVKTIEVQISELIKLTKRMGDPKCRVSWILHTARCGSTAVAQAVNAVPNCTVISETQDLSVHLMYKMKTGADYNEYIMSSEFHEIFSAMIICLFKNFGNHETACFKASAAFINGLIPLIARRFPSHRLLFIHRSGMETARSFWRMGSNLADIWLVVYVFRHFPIWLSRALLKEFQVITSNGLVPEMEHYYYNDLELFTCFFIQWVTNLVGLLRSVKYLTTPQILPVLYDDFQKNKRGVVMEIFEHLGIPSNHIDAAIDALNADSQKNSPIGRDALKDKGHWVRDEKTVRVCNQILKQFSLPDFDQKFQINRNYEIELVRE